MKGSIEKRGKNSYRLVVFKGYDLDGNAIRHQKTVHCKNKSEAQKELARSTYYRYKRMLETRITPYFRHYKLDKIKPTDIMRFYDLLEQDTQLVRKKNNNGKKLESLNTQKQYCNIIDYFQLCFIRLYIGN